MESRNPTDAELARECAAATSAEECIIACEPLAKSGTLEDAAFAQVKCLGRVDESLVCSLVARGAKRVRLACGPCERCEQKHGCDTAKLVAETANDLLYAFGSDARVSVESHEVEGKAHIAVGAVAGEHPTNEAAARENAGNLPHVMKDGTLPHFLPDRRERLLDALSQIGDGEPNRSLSNRLWGCVVIDGSKCVSCRMCATFCPTGAISNFDEDDGAFGVLHFPGDCVKCGSCRDICPEGAILLLDEVKPSYLMGGETHRYLMKPRDVKIDDPQQILNTMKTLIPGNLYER